MPCTPAEGTMSAVGVFPPAVESGDPSPGAQIYMSQPPVFPCMVSTTLTSDSYTPATLNSKSGAAGLQGPTDVSDCVLVKEEGDQWKQCRFSSPEGIKDTLQYSLAPFQAMEQMSSAPLQAQPLPALLGLSAGKALKLEGGMPAQCSSSALTMLSPQQHLVASQAGGGQQQQQAFLNSQTVTQSQLNLPIATPFGVVPFANTLQWNTGLENKLPFGMITLPGSSNINLTYPINFGTTQISDSVVRAAVLHNPNLNLTPQPSLDGVAVGPWAGLSGGGGPTVATVANSPAVSLNTQPPMTSQGLDLTNTVNKASAQPDMLNATVSVANLNFLSTLNSANPPAAAALAPPPSKKKKSKSSSQSNIPSSPKIPRKHRCQKCEYQTDNRSHLKRHENSVHSEIKPYMCYVCSKEFSRTEKIRAHFQRFHPAVEYDSSLVHRNMTPVSSSNTAPCSTSEAAATYMSTAPVASIDTPQLSNMPVYTQAPQVSSSVAVSSASLPSLPQQVPSQLASMPMFPGMPDIQPFSTPVAAIPLVTAAQPAGTSSQSSVGLPLPSPLVHPSHLAQPTSMALTSPMLHPNPNMSHTSPLPQSSPMPLSSPMAHTSPIAHVSSLPQSDPVANLSSHTPGSAMLQPPNHPTLVQQQQQPNLLVPSSQALPLPSSSTSLPHTSPETDTPTSVQTSPSKPAVRFKCELCEYSGKDSWHLRRHMSDVHEKVKEFKCPRCTYETSRKHRIISHMKSHGELDCFYCNFKTTDLEPFMAHLKQCTKEHRSIFACSHCKEHFASHKSLLNHLEKDHGTGMFRCPQCGYQCDSPLALEVHKQIHTSPKPQHMCALCSEIFVSFEALQEHLVQVHTRTVLVEKDAMSCSACSFRTQNTFHLQSHMRTHTGEMNNPDWKGPPGAGTTTDNPEYACPVCFQLLPNLSQLQAHLKDHDTEFICRMCGNVYGQKEQLDAHRQHCNMKVKPLATPKTVLEAGGEDAGKKAGVSSTDAYITALLDSHAMPAEAPVAREAVLAAVSSSSSKPADPTTMTQAQDSLLTTCHQSGLQTHNGMSLALAGHNTHTTTSYTTAMLMGNPEITPGMVTLRTVDLSRESQQLTSMKNTSSQPSDSHITATSQLLM